MDLHFGWIRQLLSKPTVERDVCMEIFGFNTKTVEACIRRKIYGNFELTDAVCPTPDLDVIPTEGYRNDLITRYENGLKLKIPTTVVAVSREKLFDLFISIIDCLSYETDVSISTSYTLPDEESNYGIRGDINTDALIGHLCDDDVKDLLLNDGCIGITVADLDTCTRVELDEHKLLYVRGTPIPSLTSLLAEQRIALHKNMKFISEGRHIHSSSDNYEERCHALRAELDCALW